MAEKAENFGTFYCPREYLETLLTLTHNNSKKFIFPRRLSLEIILTSSTAEK